MAVPRISVAAEPDTVSGHNLFIELDDFTITPENASTDPVDGEGHLHLYVDGQRVSRFYNTALQLTGLDAGEHEIMVEVSANDHSAYAVDGEPIRAMTAITVESSEGDGHSHGNSELFESETPPTIDISISEDPKSGWNLFADVGDFTFSAENVGGAAVDGEGHLHLSIDGARVTRLYGPWWHISGLEAGDHEITVEVSANDHSAYGAGGEPVIASTTLTVTEAQAMLAGAGHDDDHGDDDHGTAMDGDDHGHGGTGETLDIAAADADVAVGASLSGGDLTVENRRVTIETGQTVSITVESDVDEQVHLHGYDILSDVGPGSPAQFSFLADSAGTFEVELEESGRFLFEIQVR
jgi:ribosomal protein L31